MNYSHSIIIFCDKLDDNSYLKHHIIIPNDEKEEHVYIAEQLHAELSEYQFGNINPITEKNFRGYFWPFNLLAVRSRVVKFRDISSEGY